MNQESERPDRARYGGRNVTVTCPTCRHQIALIDPKFTRYGPVRCGACGTDLRQANLRGALASSLERRR